MDKASIIKDAIDYIQDLHDQEKRILDEIVELESGKSKKNILGYDFEQELPVLLRSKKKKIDQFYDSGGPRSISPVEVLEVSRVMLLFYFLKLKMIIKWIVEAVEGKSNGRQSTGGEHHM